MITPKEELSFVTPADWVPGPPQGSWTYEDYAALLDVDLGPKNVYQPDVVVVLNAHLDRVAAKKIIGAPDLVVEVASPSTAAYDRLTKYDIYARSGVAEYWIVKPTSRT